jgi:putative endonuclease
MGWYVYIVECKDKKLYTGICLDLKKRIREHNEGIYKGSFTKSRRPVSLLYCEKALSRFGAAKRERILKGFSRFKKLELVKSLRRA